MNKMIELCFEEDRLRRLKEARKAQRASQYFVKSEIKIIQQQKKELLEKLKEEEDG